ncbi:hypothetical protein C8J57DRAFT_1232093 [Mycena rebaudengoi]|nr:hypothetical protein C8J57DRAFT_1232093 [Mycena rebaudengoi]
MKVLIQFENLIQYTTSTASTVQEIAGSFQIPFLTSATTLTLSILKCVESVKSNRDEWMIMVEQIHEILCTIAKLCSTSEIKGVLPTALLYDIAKFSEYLPSHLLYNMHVLRYCGRTLQKIFTYLKVQQKMGKIKQLFKQPGNTVRLETCKQELNEAVEMFRVKAGGSILSHIGQMKKEAKQQHDELMALLDVYPDLSGSDCSSVMGTLSSSHNSSESFSLLPASPKIFYGRDTELHTVVNMLLEDSARVAILGAGGMGKTSLAMAALHNPQVEVKYSHIYFVACHSSPTCTELVAAIADHIGVEKGSNLSKKVAHYFTHAPPSLLVLDNLETPWESNSSRHEVEELLSLLTDVLQLGLMITLRGTERPGKVKWTRPFVQPLNPLSKLAALQTFKDIADEVHDNENISQLLELTGNLPLAVSLIASVASSEGCAKALSRWHSESTRMLSDGNDQRSSLDISIMLSFTSSRMTTGAQALLSILSMLPSGLTDADLVQAQLPISNILACKTTLVQTALAFVGQDQHLKVLVPIQEHILHMHPPADALKLKLREHFHQILDLWHQFKNLNIGDICPRISQHLANFNTVLLDGLGPGPDVVQTFKSIMFLNQFCDRFQETYSPLLLQLFEKMPLWKGHPIFGEYLIQLLESSDHLPELDFNSHITLGTQHFKSKDPLEQAQWYRALGIYFRWAKLDFVAALEYHQKALSLAESTGYPTVVGHHALCSIATTLYDTGKPWSALKYAKKAHSYAEHFGNIYGQAYSLYQQAGCYIILANYKHAQQLLEDSRGMLAACGQQKSALDLDILNFQAEIHFITSDYLESYKIQVAIASSGQPTAQNAIMAKLNIALIDTATGADSNLIHQNLDICYFNLKALYGLHAKHICLGADYGAAELCLRDGDLQTANAMLKKGFASSRDLFTDLALLFLERLGDLATGMNNIQTTLQWTGIFLALALKCEDKLQTMQAFRCLGQIFSAEGDDETALSLFNVALDGFTFMDVHRWRADCMVRTADILQNHGEPGEVIKAVTLWKTAKPLFERSSQMNDVTRIDTKLASVDIAVMIDYQKQLQQLAERKVSVHATEEMDIVEDGDKDELAQGRDVGDGVWV